MARLHNDTAAGCVPLSDPNRARLVQNILDGESVCQLCSIVNTDDEMLAYIRTCVHCGEPHILELTLICRPAVDRGQPLQYAGTCPQEELASSFFIHPAYKSAQR